MTPNQQVLSDEKLCEVLTTAYGSPEWMMDDVRAARAIESATLAALAQQAQPVAWMHTGQLGARQAFTSEPPPSLKAQCQPLYTTPPAPQVPHQCPGIPRKGCNYTAACGSVCNKCGQVHHAHALTPPPVPAPVDERDAWLPIESALKDGTRLILWWGGKPVFAGWLDNSQCEHPWAGWQTPSLTPRPQGEPTHWQPLPTAPQTKGGEA